MSRPEARNEAPMVSITGDDGFCLPYMLNLSVSKKIMDSDMRSDVSDSSGNLLLRISGSLWQWPHKRKRVVYNPSGLPLLTIGVKTFLLLEQWTVHRGDSSDASNLLYTVRQSPFFKQNQKLGIFLSSNHTISQPDFDLTASFLGDSFKVHKGIDLLAKVKEKYSFRRMIGEKDFDVRVYPGVDYAFIVSLVVIFSEIFVGR